MLDPTDVSPLDRPRATAAAARFTLREVTDPADPAFDEGWDLLASFFLDAGELEDREVLRDFVRRRRVRFDDDATGTYAFVCAFDGDRMVGVRDCYVDVEHRQGVCVVALSHTWVAPDCRRTGLAALFRALPVSLARRELAALGRDLPTIVAAEMEPVHPSVPDTVVRLIAYGRSGFSVLDPSRLSYCQPDLRPAVERGVPLLAVVRPVNLPPGPIPTHVAAAYPRLFHACHRTWLPRARVDRCEAHARDVLGRSDAPVPLLPLPTSMAELDRLAPLVRGAVLPNYPEELRGGLGWGDPVEELRDVLARWNVSPGA